MVNHQTLITQLYAQYKTELSRYVSHQFKLELSECEDIVQITFIKLARLRKLKDLDNPRAYLYRMVHNQVIDTKRSERRRQESEDGAYIDLNPETSTVNDPARVNCAHQRLGIVQRVIDKAPPTRRAILTMSRHDNLSNSEIGRRLGISEAAVRKHLTRALVDIKIALKAAERAPTL